MRIVPAPGGCFWSLWPRRWPYPLVRTAVSTGRYLTDESLDGHTEPVEGPGWPEPRSYPVRECLLVILNEEWEHRLYAERDLNALETRSS